mgnify:CR=1 FL=1
MTENDWSGSTATPTGTRTGKATEGWEIERITDKERTTVMGLTGVAFIQLSGGTPEADVMKVHRLTDRRVLLEVPCGMGAYNFSSLLFMANDRPPYQPKPLDDVDGEFDAETGTVHSSMKGRGIGDCWWVREWRFDGKGFVLSGEHGDGMCRGFPGGAWQLPAYVTQ